MSELEDLRAENEALKARIESQRKSLDVGREMYVTVCEMNDRLMKALEEIRGHSAGDPIRIENIVESALQTDDQEAPDV